MNQVRVEPVKKVNSKNKYIQYTVNDIGLSKVEKLSEIKQYFKISFKNKS